MTAFRCRTSCGRRRWQSTALLYPDGRVPILSPVYDFHSLSIYAQYRHNALALSLNDERVAGRIRLDHFQRLAEPHGYSAQWTAEVVSATVDALRSAWQGDLRREAASRFEALDGHFAARLQTLPICAAM